MVKLPDPETRRIWMVIGLYTAFLSTELVIGFTTHALVLIADAFHCLNDIITLAIVLTATKYSKRQDAPESMPFGYERAKVLGGFFNGVFLLALSFSIFLQAIEQFVHIDPVDDPKLLLIIGGVGFIMNLTVPFIYDDHDGHGHGHVHNDDHTRKLNVNEKGTAAVSDVPISEVVHDMEMNVSILPPHFSSQSTTKGTFFFRTRRYIRSKLVPKDFSRQAVVQHALGDAINNLGVMAASIIMMYVKSEGRFYADPAMSVLIAMGIFYYASKMVKNSGMILLGSVPGNVTVHQVKENLEAVDGVRNVHNVVIWALSQSKCVVTAHVVLESDQVEESSQTNAHIVHVKGGRLLEGSSRKAVLGRLDEALREAVSPTEIYSITLQIEAYDPCSEDDTTDQSSAD